MGKISVNKLLIRIFLLLSLLAAFKIPYIHEVYPRLIKYINYISIISFIFLLILIKKITIKNFAFYLLGYYLILIGSTLLGHNSISEIINEIFLFITPILIINSFDKEEFNDYISTILFAFEIMAYINIISIILFPNGLYNIGLSRKFFFLGHVNISIRYLLPGSCIALMHSYMKYNKLTVRSIIYIICSALTLLITTPATAIVGYTVFILMNIVIIRFNNLKALFNPFNSYLICLIISYLIIGIGIQPQFINIITNILHRDITFTGRTLIWANSLKYVKSKPIYGYGRLLDEYRRKFFVGATSAHNQYLNLLFESGIISLAYIFLIFYILKNKIKQCNNQKIVSALLATIMSYAVMWIFEPFSYSGTFCMFLIYAIIYKSSTYFNVENPNQEV